MSHMVTISTLFSAGSRLDMSMRSMSFSVPPTGTKLSPAAL